MPSAGLPLHVFEPRYRTLVQDCLAGDHELGVVLIERGSEVGGGDLRSDIGTRARIIEAIEGSDGRWGLVLVGVRRMRVLAWLPDDPYPRAEVADWQDPLPGAGHDALLRLTLARLRRCLALSAEAGDATAPATIELSDDPILAGYQASAVAPLGPLDQQRLLCAATPEERLTLLGELLDDALTVLELRLGADGAGG